MHASWLRSSRPISFFSRGCFRGSFEYRHNSSGFLLLAVERVLLRVRFGGGLKMKITVSYHHKQFIRAYSFYSSIIPEFFKPYRFIWLNQSCIMQIFCIFVNSTCSQLIFISLINIFKIRNYCFSSTCVCNMYYLLHVVMCGFISLCTLRGDYDTVPEVVQWVLL